MLRRQAFVTTRLYKSGHDFLSEKTSEVLWKSPSMGLSLNRFYLNEQTEAYYAYQNHMIALPLCGKGRLEWVCDAKKGHAEILPQHITIEPAHRFLHRCSWKDMICLTLHIEPEALARAVHEDFDPEQVALRPVINQSDPIFILLLNSLLEALDSSTTKDFLKAEVISTRIFGSLLEHYLERPKQIRKFKRGLSREQLNRVLVYVDQQLHEKVRLTDLAKQAGGVSPFHFARLFRLATGYPPHQYILKQRVARAVAMLREGKLDLIEVAFKAGFSDQSHMTRVLQEKIHQSPAKLLPKKARLFKRAG